MCYTYKEHTFTARLMAFWNRESHHLYAGRQTVSCQNLFCRLVQSSEKNRGPSHTSSAPSWRDISPVNVDPDRVAAGPGQTGPGLLLGPAQRRGPPSAPQDSTGSRVNLHGHFHCLPYCSISTCPRLDC